MMSTLLLLFFNSSSLVFMSCDPMMPNKRTNEQLLDLDLVSGVSYFFNWSAVSCCHVFVKSTVQTTA